MNNVLINTNMKRMVEEIWMEIHKVIISYMWSKNYITVLPVPSSWQGIPLL